MKKIESWHKLIRVLTHEINNTLSPITSLANSLEKLFKNHTSHEVSKQLIEKANEGLHIISERGEGLIEFVNNYRNISSIKKIIGFLKLMIIELEFLAKIAIHFLS